MKIFYNNTFSGHYPVPTAAVIIAENKQRAIKLLNGELVRHGLPADVRSVVEISTACERAVIIQDGDY